MVVNAFTPLANFRLPSPSRLVGNSCCPEKDLVVLFSRLGGTDRMSLWNISQGSRIWEVGVSEGNVNSQAIGIAWSPDGQSIAVICEPPSVALHSLQDGHITLSLTLPASFDGEGGSIHFTGIWWFRDERRLPQNSSIPDIFKRNDTITGSAPSILRLLPLLDSLQEESDKLTATDLFAFQGSHTRLSHKSEFPKGIAKWPTLSTDLPTASISSASLKVPSDGANLDENDTSNVNSVLMVADDSGHLFCYLDGTFPLGFISSYSKTNIFSIVKHPSRPLFVGQPRSLNAASLRTFLDLAVIDIPLLSQRKTRDFAKLSSAARELMWYTMRVTKEMHEAWYGSESITGARELGPKWVRSLEEKQKEQFGQEDPTPILDLTSLLTTGRPTESLADFLGSGEQMSDRGIQKWETTVSDTLIKLRDSSEKKIAPALQRLFLILDELRGWSQLSQFSLFELQTDQLTQCIDLASRGIVITSWLAAIVRREFLRFREFMTWLRYEVNTVNSPNEGHIARHDLLEVNNYLMDGLESSIIDKWFVGPVPQFQPSDMGAPRYGNVALTRMLQRARSHADNSSEMSWQKGSLPNDVEKLDRNIVALIGDLANRCERIFSQASGSTSRSATISFDGISNTEGLQEHSSAQSLSPLFRERTVLNEAGELVQHLIARISSSEDNAIFLVKLRYEVVESGSQPEIGIVPFECYLADEISGQRLFDILDADFFDDESVVIIGRLRQEERQTFVAMLKYNGIGYQTLQSDGYVRVPTREDLMQNGWRLWKKGHLSTTRVPINRRRVLSGCKSGGVSLALNGRVGRRVACVLDSAGTTLESFDLEGDGEETEVADDTRAG